MRRPSLLSCLDVVQDLRIHRNEIHSKLVAIMRERLTVNLKQLPSVAAAWGTGAPGLKQPSAFAQAIAKQLRILCQVGVYANTYYIYSGICGHLELPPTHREFVS